MAASLSVVEPTDLCRLIERDGILVQLADHEIGGLLADEYLRHVRRCPHCLPLAADLLYTDALLKSTLLADWDELPADLIPSSIQVVVPRPESLAVSALTPGERLTADLFSLDGSLLLMEGTLLSHNILAALESRGIHEVYLGTVPEPLPVILPTPVVEVVEVIEEHPSVYLQTPQAAVQPVGEDAHTPGGPLHNAAAQAAVGEDAQTPGGLADVIYRLDEVIEPVMADELPPEIKEGFFFAERGTPRKFHPNDYRDLLFTAKGESAIAQTTKLRAYSQLERSLTELKEAGAADLTPVRQTSHQIVTELLKDDRLTVSLTDLFLVSSQLFSHCFNTLVTFVGLGRALKVPMPDLLAAGECVLLHDLGRILPAEEGLKAEYHDHADRTYRYLLAQGNFNERVLSIVLHHHERVDGAGFPKGLRGEALSTLDQLLILANTYDNLVTDPVHGVKRSFHRAAQAIIQAGGRLVSPRVTHAFLDVFGMYPPGSLVMLQSRELCLVKEATLHRPFQPQVTVLREASGAPVAAPYSLDLCEAGVPIARAVEVEAVLEY